MSKRIPINEVLLEEARQKAEVLVNDLISSDPTHVAAVLTQLCPREEDWEKLFLKIYNYLEW